MNCPLLALTVLLGLGACKKEPAPAAGPAPAVSLGKSVVAIDSELLRAGRIQVGLAERRAPRGETHLAGEVASDEAGQADVGALVSGRVAAIEAREGMPVAKGQVMAWVDAPEVGRAAAEVMRARARAAVAAHKIERQLALQQQEATSKNAVDEARAEDQIARADLAAARTLLVNLGGAEPAAAVAGQPTTAVAVRVAVRSPIAGIVAQRHVVLGAPVSPDKSLFRVVAADRVMIKAKVPETFGVLPADGTPAQLEPRGAAGLFPRCTATVSGHFAVIDETARAQTLRLLPAAGCAWLVPGGYVDVVFSAPPAAPAAPAAREIVVPKEAVVDVHGAPAVFVPAAAAGEFTVHAVRVRGAPTVDLVVEAGLVEGEKVVIAGALLLKGELLRAELGGP